MEPGVYLDALRALEQIETLIGTSPGSPTSPVEVLREALNSIEWFKGAIQAAVAGTFIEFGYLGGKGAVSRIKTALSARESGIPEEARIACLREVEGLAKLTDAMFRSDGKNSQFIEEIERRSLHPVGSSAAIIIGCRRSGTTLLAWLLDSHPNIACLPENELCSRLLDLASDGSSRWLRTNIVRAQKSVADLGETRARFYARFAGLVDGVFSDYAKRTGKKRWVCKELFVHESLDLLDLMFGYSGKFLYIYRHGLDVAISASERFGGFAGAPIAKGGLDIREYLLEWVANNEATLDFAERNPDRCLVVKYEDLVRNPEPMARSLIDFLGEPWVPDLIESMQTKPHDRRLGDHKIAATGGKILSDRIDRWRHFPQPLLRQLGRIANPTLARLGYPTV